MSSAKFRIVSANSYRLANLQRYTKTAGVSWDELDAVYTKFIDDMTQRVSTLNDCKTEWMHKAAKESEDIVRQERKEFLKKKQVDIDILDDNSPMILPRSLHRRTTKRLFRQWTSEHMKQFERGQLHKRMAEFVHQKVSKRQAMDQIYGQDQEQS